MTNLAIAHRGALAARVDPDEHVREASHRVVDVNVDTEEGRVEAIAAAIAAVADARGAPRPAPRAIDGLAIAAQMGEAYLREAYGLGEADARRMWLRRCVLKAGVAPALDLSSFVVTTTYVRTEVDPGSKCGYISHLTCHLGTMTVDLAIDHPIVATRHRVASYPDLDVVLGPAERRYYGAGHRGAGVQIAGVAVDRERASASASIELTAPGGPISHGLGSSYVPFVSPIDAIRTAVELAPLLLEERGGGDGGGAGGVWLRKLVVESVRPATLRGPFEVTTWRLKTGVRPRSGRVWRDTTFGMRFPVVDGAPAVAGEYVLAHPLSDRA